MELRGPSWRGRRVHTPSRLPTGHAGPWSLCPVGGQPTKTGPLTGWGGQDTPGIPDTAEATIRDAGAAGCCLLRLQERVPPASASLCPPHPCPTSRVCGHLPPTSLSSRGCSAVCVSYEDTCHWV